MPLIYKKYFHTVIQTTQVIQHTSVIVNIRKIYKLQLLITVKYYK